MFDIGWQELFLIAVVALIVIGPKDLPRVMRTVMAGIRKAREMARDPPDGLEEVARRGARGPPPSPPRPPRHRPPRPGPRPPAARATPTPPPSNLPTRRARQADSEPWAR